MAFELTGDDDQLFHPSEGDLYWNESSFISLHVPERGINGFIYYVFRPNMHMAIAGPALWDTIGENTWDCLFYDWDWPLEIPADAQFGNFQLGNGLSVHNIEPYKKIEIGYENDGCALQLTWDAVTSVATSVPAGGVAESGRRHYDQFGRMKGTIEVDAGRIDVDCFSIRDRSWGPRRMQRSPEGDFVWAMASPEHAFQGTFAGAPGDPEQPLAVGTLIRDGVMSPLVEGRRWVTERDGPRPTVVRIEAVDENGRTLEAVGRMKNWFEWQGYGHQFEWWCLTEWEFDGVRAWGEEQEYYPLQAVRRHCHKTRTAV